MSFGSSWVFRWVDKQKKTFIKELCFASSSSAASMPCLPGRIENLRHQTELLLKWIINGAQVSMEFLVLFDPISLSIMQRLLWSWFFEKKNWRLIEFLFKFELFDEFLQAAQENFL